MNGFVVGAVSFVVAALALAGGLLYVDSVRDERELRASNVTARRRGLRAGRAQQRAIDREAALADLTFMTFEQGQRRYDNDLEQRRRARRANRPNRRSAA